MEQDQTNNNNLSPKEKTFTLDNLSAKLNKKETVTFGNFYVNFKDMFKKEDDFKDYFKRHVSLFNDDPINKEKITTVTSFLKPEFMDNFDVKTLFYIFYYMPRDSLQLYAADHLYKNDWIYNYKYQIWFKKIENSEDKWEYFNPLEWKKSEYIFGSIEQKYFLPEEEAFSYTKQLAIELDREDKKKQGKQSKKEVNNNSSQSNNADN